MQKKFLLKKNLFNKNFREVTARSRQRKHNRNYNLMGFDTIEINLVQFIFEVCKYASMYSSMQVCKYASIQVYKYASM